MLTDKEKLFISLLLKKAAEEFSCHICDDLSQELKDVFTTDEWKDLGIKCAKWNEHTETPKEIEPSFMNWIWMYYFSYVLGKNK